MTVSIIGIDPGGTTGVALLQMWPGDDGAPRYCLPISFQVKGMGAGAENVVTRLREEFGLLFATSGINRRKLVFAVEAFVVGSRAGRSATPQAGELARKIIGQVHALALDLEANVVVSRSASQVKAWATDVRLKAATGAVGPGDGRHGTGGVPMPSLLVATQGKPHARDAARHALFAAVQDVRWPDPLSRLYAAERTRR